MASYQARQRDPLLDQNTQAVLERRGKELFGAGLVVAGVLVVLMLASYSPEDPSWMVASDAPAQNYLGRFGAAIASPLFIIVGFGAWMLPLGLIAWGLRYLTHRGEDRAISRATFLPISVALTSVYAALLVPGAEWGQAFGMGGHFGDMVAGSVLGMSPVAGSFGLKLMALLFAVLMLAMGAYVLGFDRVELRAIARFLILGTVTVYAMSMTALGRGAAASVLATQRAAERARARRAEATERAAEMAAWQAQQSAWDARQHGQAAAPLIAERPSLINRIRRAVEPDPMPDLQPELVEPVHSWGDEDPAAPSEDRIRARIASAVKSRAPMTPAAPVLRAEPVLHAGQAAGSSLAPIGQLRADARPIRADAAPDLAQPMPKPDAAVAATTPASVLSAVAARLARGPRLPLAETRRAAGPLLRTEPPLQAVPRFMPAPPVVAAPAAAPQIAQAPIAAAPESDFVLDDCDDDARFDRNAFAALDDDDDDAIASPDPALHAPLNRHPVVAQDPRRMVQHAPKKVPAPSRQALAEAQPRLRFDAPAAPAYEHPPLGLLMNPVTIQRHSLSDEALEENARMLENVLDDYGVKGEIVSVRPGPVVTMYELEPAPGLKASRVIGLADDIARSMSALSARVSTVPGRSVIGIELPNAHREKVVLREILAARDFGDTSMRLPLALGKDISGEPIVANLAKMPHLLIAGTTGSGKSVAINTMILSLLYKLSPEECRLIMIDPKMLELSVYDGIPHLLSPVVTDPKKAVVALKWVVGEMEERYRKMSKMGVRNIEGYNGRVREALAKGEMFKRTVQTGFDENTGEPIFETDEFQPGTIPYIVVVVDEMADLMMVAGKEIEACIQRLAQMARASGIHLIMATQRPSVDVITGTIKANFPTRISFQVTSKIDSRTILGEQGAEQLLGMGDMLYMAGGSRITRIHGPFVSDEEVEEIVNHLKSFGPPEYMSGVVDGPDDEREADIDAVLGLGGGDDVENALYDTAVAIVIKDRKCSTSYIQRKLGIGYNKAARLVEQMEDQGIVTAANHVGKREILVPEQ